MSFNVACMFYLLLFRCSLDFVGVRLLFEGVAMTLFGIVDLAFGFSLWLVDCFVDCWFSLGVYCLSSVVLRERVWCVLLVVEICYYVDFVV